MFRGYLPDGFLVVGLVLVGVGCSRFSGTLAAFYAGSTCVYLAFELARAGRGPE